MFVPNFRALIIAQNVIKIEDSDRIQDWRQTKTLVIV